MVTPDAERRREHVSCAGDHVGADDIDDEVIARAGIVYVEGYLCGLPSTEGMPARAAAAAHRAGGRFALSLSDPFWVELHGKELDALLDDVDILFGNRAEALGICGTDDLAAADRPSGRALRDRERDPRRRRFNARLRRPGRRSARPSGRRRGRHDRGRRSVHRPVSCGGCPTAWKRPPAPCSAAWPRPRSSSHLGARPQVPLADMARRAGLLPDS